MNPSTVLAQGKGPLVYVTDTEGGPPYFFSSKDDAAVPIGFEVDLRDALAKELGRPIEYKHAQFDSLFPTLNREIGSVDFAMNGLEITPNNLRLARFTRPYFIY